MPTFYASDIDIDPGEYLDSCSSREKETLVEYLREEGYITDVDPGSSVLDLEWAEVIRKISGNARLLLTSEEEELIKKIAARL